MSAGLSWARHAPWWASVIRSRSGNRGGDRSLSECRRRCHRPAVAFGRCPLCLRVTLLLLLRSPPRPSDIPLEPIDLHFLTDSLVVLLLFFIVFGSLSTRNWKLPLIFQQKSKNRISDQSISASWINKATCQQKVCCHITSIPLIIPHLSTPSGTDFQEAAMRPFQFSPTSVYFDRCLLFSKGEEWAQRNISHRVGNWWLSVRSLYARRR